MSTYPYIFNVGAMALEINIPASDFDIEPELLEKKSISEWSKFFSKNIKKFPKYSDKFKLLSNAIYTMHSIQKTKGSIENISVTTNFTARKRLSLNPNTVNKSRKQLIMEQRAARARAVEIVVVVGLVLAMLFGVLYTYVQKNELTKSIAGIQQEISVAKSENVSLNAELEALVSVSQIDSYALEKLGMTRLESNQIVYIDTSEYEAEQKQEQQQQEQQDQTAQAVAE